MPYYQVITTYGGTRFDDCAMDAPDIETARHEACYQYSSAYGFKPGEGPDKIEVKRISRKKALDIVDSGGLDWLNQR